MTLGAPLPALRKLDRGPALGTRCILTIVLHQFKLLPAVLRHSYAHQDLLRFGFSFEPP